MNYIDRIKYMTTHGYSDIYHLIPSLLTTIKMDGIPLRITFFTAAAGEEEYVSQRDFVYSILKIIYPTGIPAWSLISQPAAGKATIAAEVCYIVPEKTDRISYKNFNTIDYSVLENECGKFVFAGGIRASINTPPVMAKQASEVFYWLDELLASENMPVNSIQRQWNYIERITEYDGDEQRYQAFNNERAKCYDRYSWEHGYPAATGIGSDYGGLIIDFDAAMLTPKVCSKAINNPMQAPAHSYSEKMLKDTSGKAATPKFERARSLKIGERELIYISGTAAIRGEESLAEAGIEQQIEITLNNIYSLIGDANITELRVYIKNASDAEIVEKTINDLFPRLFNASFMIADVCRDELLVEIEGIAVL